LALVHETGRKNRFVAALFIELVHTSFKRERGGGKGEEREEKRRSIGQLRS